MKISGILAAALLVLAGMRNPTLGQPVSPSEMLVNGNNAFALDLYSKLKGAEGNLFFSPYSISTCLGMTYAGAKGNTEKQMAKVFHFGSQTDTASGFADLQRQLNALEKKNKFELNIANGLWAQKGKMFLFAFLDVAQRRYGARLELADFKTAAEPTRKEINDWVSDKTKGRITDLMPQGSLAPLTRLVLVNAIYFKGSWQTQFPVRLTMDEVFHSEAGRSVTTKLMAQTATFKYAEKDDLQALEMNYAGGDLSMIVLLPKKYDGLHALEDKLSVDGLNQLLLDAKSAEVRVILPKFKLTSQFSLKETLEQMGMPDAFSDQSDFSGMDGTRLLYISTVVHKAYVDVNEEGTEAAASTGVVMMARGIQRHQPPVFRADHPFIFLIRDTHSGSILFLGRVTDPTK